MDVYFTAIEVLDQSVLEVFGFDVSHWLLSGIQWQFVFCLFRLPKGISYNIEYIDVSGIWWHTQECFQHIVTQTHTHTNI